MTESSFQSEITARYDAPMYRAMLEVYGDQIHPGLFEDEDEPLYVAAQRATARLAEMAEIPHGCHVLETACGVGGTARYLAATFGCSVLATNISRGQLAIAEDWTAGKAGSHRITYEFADFENLPYDDAAFDVYWCQDSLLFSGARTQALAEAERVIRPGGIVVLSDLALIGSPEGDVLELMKRISEPGLWSFEEYASALAEAGLVIAAKESWNRHVLPSFTRILNDIKTRKDQLAGIASLDDVEETIERYLVWCEAGRTGHLGWIAMVARKRDG